MRKETIMNKKTLLRIFVALLTLSVAIASFAACGNENDGVVDESKNESSSSVSKDESDSSLDESTTENGDDTSSENSSDPEGESSNDENSSEGENSEPEILGQGSKDDPYYEIPTEDLTVTTVEVPAGQSMFYGIYRVGGTILKIKSDNAYVICDGKRYDSKNGKVSFTIPDALASEAIMFEIGNKGSTAESFVIEFSNATGSQMNPAEVESMGDEFEISLKEGQSTGYYYRYIAEKAGTIRFYIDATEASVMIVTNNRNSAQRTSADDSTEDGYFEIVVEEGDEIIINVGATPSKRGKYPATTITWHGEFA